MDDPSIHLPDDDNDLFSLSQNINKFPFPTSQGSASSGSSQSDEDSYINDSSGICKVNPPPENSFKNIFDHQFTAEEYRCKLKDKDTFKLVLDRDNQQRELLSRWKKWVDEDADCRYVKKKKLLRYLRDGLSKTDWFLKATKKSKVFQAFEATNYNMKKFSEKPVIHKSNDYIHRIKDIQIIIYNII